MGGGDRHFKYIQHLTGQRQRPNYANQERPHNPHKDDIGIRYIAYMYLIVYRAIIF